MHIAHIQTFRHTYKTHTNTYTHAYIHTYNTKIHMICTYTHRYTKNAHTDTYSHHANMLTFQHIACVDTYILHTYIYRYIHACTDIHKCIQHAYIRTHVEETERDR